MKKYFEYFPPGSPIYVILHADYRQSRGRRPVAIGATTRNPRIALEEAREFLGHGLRLMIVRTVKPCSLKTMQQIMHIIGLRPVTLGEINSHIEQNEVDPVLTNFRSM